MAYIFDLYYAGRLWFDYLHLSFDFVSNDRVRNWMSINKLFFLLQIKYSEQKIWLLKTINQIYSALTCPNKIEQITQVREDVLSSINRFIVSKKYVVTEILIGLDSAFVGTQQNHWILVNNSLGFHFLEG